MADARLNGLNPLSYLGVNAYTPPNLTTQSFNPTQYDSAGFILGALWLNTSLLELYMLVALNGGIATWVLITGPSGSVVSLTGNTGGAVGPLAGNINVVGDGTTITITGVPGTHTLTASVIGGLGTEHFITDSGTATPVGGNITFNAVSQAGSSVTFSGAGATVRLNTSDALSNTIVGNLAGNATLTGTSNTGLGKSVLHALTTGVQNTAVGASALQANATDSDNTSVGYHALFLLNDTNSRLTAVGSLALASITSGSATVAVGYKALTALGGGSGNTAIGWQALQTSAGDNNNTALGFNSLQALNGGNNNTALGAASMAAGGFTGSNNVVIGFNAGNSFSGAESNNTVVGPNAIAMTGENGVVRIGSPIGAGNNANTFVGWLCGNSTYTLASAINNTAVGAGALPSITTANNNTAIGHIALSALTTGNQNTAVGNGSLNSLTTGSGNTAVGDGALNFLSGAGSENTAVGNNAGSGVGHTGSNNISIGTNAGISYAGTESDNTLIGTNIAGRVGESATIRIGASTTPVNIFIGGGGNSLTVGMATLNNGVGLNTFNALTTGGNNNAFGSGALAALTTGGQNNAFGNALNHLTTGIQNTAIGYFTGDTLTTGSYNTFIGNSSGVTTNATSNSNIYIHHQGGTVEDHVLRIGENGDANLSLSKVFIDGIRGITTGVADAVPVLIDSAGQLGVTSSSRRFKQNIEDMGIQSSPAMKLRPVTFTYITDKGNQKQFGLIAEEVDTIMPEIVVYDPEDGLPETVQYHELPVILLNELQKLTERVLKLEAQLKLK